MLIFPSSQGPDLSDAEPSVGRIELFRLGTGPVTLGQQIFIFAVHGRQDRLIAGSLRQPRRIRFCLADLGDHGAIAEGGGAVHGTKLGMPPAESTQMDTTNALFKRAPPTTKRKHNKNKKYTKCFYEKLNMEN